MKHNAGSFVFASAKHEWMGEVTSTLLIRLHSQVDKQVKQHATTFTFALYNQTKRAKHNTIAFAFVNAINLLMVGLTTTAAATETWAGVRTPFRHATWGKNNAQGEQPSHSDLESNMNSK